MSNIAGIRRMVSTHLWAMVPEYMEAMLDVIQLRASGLRLSDEEIAERIAAANHGALGAAAGRPVPPSSGLVAVLPLYGVIAQRSSMVNQTSGPRGTSTEAFGQAFDVAMGNDQVSALVLDIDSPGGTINGVQELYSKILNARGTKRIVAVASGMAASAAYWIASAADEIAVTPSGEVGSIGVYTVHSDLSGMMAAEGVKQTIVKAGKYKAEGHPSQPLDEGATAAMQERVDEAYGTFVNAVAKGRDVSVSDVRSGYGEGRIVSASKAKELGMVDRIATLDEVIGRLASSRGGAKPGRRADLERRKLALADSDAAL
jgi:signal peptide peptidase SppA